MKTSLFAMGGAVQLDGSILRAFYERSGGPDANIVILPTASANAGAGQNYREAFNKFRLHAPARILPVHQRGDARRSQYCQAIQAATGIFLTGGNPLRLVDILGGTQLHEAMLAAYRRGVVIGGTSAGSAALSTVMLAFGSSGAFPRQRIAQAARGLGFEPAVIFDQHFRQRNRLGRLMYAVSSAPDLLGVGIDENTAVVIEDNQLSVIGQHGVTIVDGAHISGSNITAVERGDIISVSDIRLHLLNAGGRFHLKNRTAIFTTTQHSPMT